MSETVVVEDREAEEGGLFLIVRARGCQRVLLRESLKV